MGLVGFLRGLVDLKFAGRDIIEKQIEAYYKERSLDPGQAQHIHLARAWLSRQAYWGDDINSPEEQTRAYTVTLHCACVAHPTCAEALGLLVLRLERPDIMEQYPECFVRFKQVMKPVLDAEQSGTLRKLYRKFNPTMKEDDMEMIEGLHNKR
jgi:hypothetical protein